MTILYSYQAALYCEACGERIRAELTAQGKAPPDPRLALTRWRTTQKVVKHCALSAQQSRRMMPHSATLTLKVRPYSVTAAALKLKVLMEIRTLRASS